MKVGRSSSEPTLPTFVPQTINEEDQEETTTRRGCLKSRQRKPRKRVSFIMSGKELQRAHEEREQQQRALALEVEQGKGDLLNGFVSVDKRTGTILLDDQDESKRHPSHEEEQATVSERAHGSNGNSCGVTIPVRHQYHFSQVKRISPHPLDQTKFDVKVSPDEDSVETWTFEAKSKCCRKNWIAYLKNVCGVSYRGMEEMSPVSVRKPGNNKQQVRLLSIPEDM
ncbi:hypothetical protein QOT17_018511 [Balamuthia mandrillaris]